MNYKGRSIWEMPTLKSGMTIGNPLLDWGAAAQWWGMTWEQFQESDNKNYLVATYHTIKQMEAVIEFVRYRKMRQQSRPGKRPRRR